MKHKTQISVLTAACFSDRVNALIPTLVKSKFFMTRVPGSQSSETDVNLTITPKKIISNILVSISVIHENKWYVNCLCLFFHFAQWTQWRTVRIHRLFYQRFYCLQTGISLYVVSKKVNFSLLLVLPKYLFKILAGQNISSKCTDTIWYYITRQTLNFPTLFLLELPNFRTYIFLCIGTDINDMHETKSSGLEELLVSIT